MYATDGQRMSNQPPRLLWNADGRSTHGKAATRVGQIRREKGMQYFLGLIRVVAQGAQEKPPTEQEFGGVFLMDFFYESTTCQGTITMCDQIQVLLCKKEGQYP